MRKTIVCLANSYKHGGRCVAGVCVDDGRWVRLRGKASDGALMPQEYRLHDGTEARVGDLLEVELHFAQPSEHHPEDWAMAPVPWRLLERPLATRRWTEVARQAATGGATIFRGYRDRVSAEELRRQPMTESLALVCPEKLWWWVREERGKRKCRALFYRNHVTYDFALTDPHWLARLDLMPTGIYENSTFVNAAEETWLALSLSEAFAGWHYKLVAGVVVR